MKEARNTTHTNIGLIGAGYIGKAHSHGYRNLAHHPLHPKLFMVATTNATSAERAADTLGYRYFTDDWREVCTHPDTDIVCIASPITVHFEQVKCALENGKHVAIEKPIVKRVEELLTLQKLAKKAGVKLSVGFNYIHNPMIYHAKKLIDEGVIGDLVSFRVIHSEDFLARPDDPFHDYNVNQEMGAGGVIREIAPHPLAMVNYLVGDVRELCAKTKKQYDMRGDVKVTIEDDHVDALLDMGGNLQGTLTASWLNSGRGMNLAFEIYGNKGAVCFNQERLNELDLYLPKDKSRKGCLTIRAAGEHEGFSLLCPGDEHGIGFMDLKTLESKQLLDAIHSGGESVTNFDFGVRVEKQMDAMYQSSRSGTWVTLA